MQRQGVVSPVAEENAGQNTSTCLSFVLWYSLLREAFVLKNHSQIHSLTLRPVLPQDCEQLFIWNNDSVVRTFGFHNAPLIWEEHCRWFETFLANPAQHGWIALAPEPVGILRLACEGPIGTVSIVVAAEHRGRGFGLAMLTALHREVEQRSLAKTLQAFVRSENQASRHLFLQTGYQQIPDEILIAGHRALRFVLDCSPV